MNVLFGLRYVTFHRHELVVSGGIFGGGGYFSGGSDCISEKE